MVLFEFLENLFTLSFATPSFYTMNALLAETMSTYDLAHSYD